MVLTKGLKRVKFMLLVNVNYLSNMCKFGARFFHIGPLIGMQLSNVICSVILHT